MLRRMRFDAGMQAVRDTHGLLRSGALLMLRLDLVRTSAASGVQ